MICFYGAALGVSLLLIVALTVFNFIYLKEETLVELKEATRIQASTDLQHLVTQGAGSLNAEFGSILSMFAMMEGILSTRESVQGPERLPNYKYEELPKECLQQMPGYGEDFVCFDHSSVVEIGSVEDELVTLTSRLDYVLPSILSVNAPLIMRIILYFPTENGQLIRVFPGSKLPTDYEITHQTWYEDLISSEWSLKGSRPYVDPFGSGNTLISHARILRNAQGESIGIGCADTSISAFTRSQVNFTSFDSAQVFIVALDGGIVPFTGYPPLSFSNLSEADPLFWSELKRQPVGFRSLSIDDTIMEVASSPLGDWNNPSNWWYVLMVSVSREDIQYYLRPTEDDFNRAMLWLLLATLGCAGLTAVVVFVCIIIVERQVTRPLQGIMKFTDKVNATDASECTTLIQELEDLHEGKSQVASLVTIYKSLMRSLLTNTRQHTATQRETSDYMSYPVNHLYRGGALWKSDLAKLKSE